MSFLAFCGSNVLIDTESLYNMIEGRPRIHTFLHTYPGATLAAAGVVVVFWLLVRLAPIVRLPNLFDWQKLSLRQLIVGALLGAWSHVVLDSIMHADITPLMPVSSSNPLFHLISVTALHWFCVVSGIVALGVMRWRATATGSG